MFANDNTFIKSPLLVLKQYVFFRFIIGTNYDVWYTIV